MIPCCETRAQHRARTPKALNFPLDRSARRFKQKAVPPINKDRGWDFRIGKNSVIEHFRNSDGRVAVRETGDKIHILDQDYDALALALDRAVERFGTYLHFDGNQAGARILVDIVVTRDLRVTFTDDRLLLVRMRPKRSLAVGEDVPCPALEAEALRDKILEYQATLSNLGPSNIRVHVRFVANGSTQELSEEFKQELAAIRADYDNNTFEHFSIEALGCDELIDLSKAQERQTRRVDANLRLRYDTNNPSLIKYYSQDLKGLVCSVPASRMRRATDHTPSSSISPILSA